MITSDDVAQKLPVEMYCNEAITKTDLAPSNFARQDICEISRLAVPAEFRRRKLDRYHGSGIGNTNQYTFTEGEARCFPFIAVGLYLCATTVLAERGIKHCYVMIEPRLARGMRMIGLEFEKIGNVTEYHGKRAPYYIKPMEVPNNLRENFRSLLVNIESEIGMQKAG